MNVQTIVGQTSKKAIITQSVELREIPDFNSLYSVILPKNKVVSAIPSFSKGWYLVTTDSRPFLSGYVHGNNIRFVEEKKTIPKPTPKPKVKSPPKNSKIIIPKGSMDTDVPVYDVELEEGGNQGKNQKPKSTQLPKTSFGNLCKGGLYCPDIQEIVSVLISEEWRFSKGKFEKSEEYTKRLKNVLSEFKLSNSHTFADEMIIVYQPEFDSYEQRYLKYDADSEIWSFAVETEKVKEEMCLPITSNLRGTKYCLSVKGGIEIPKPFYFNVSMSPKEAAENDNKLFIAFVGNFKVPDYAKILPPPYPYTEIEKAAAMRAVEAATRAYREESKNTIEVTPLFPDIMRVPKVEFNVKEVICLNPSTGKKWSVTMKKTTKDD